MAESVLLRLIFFAIGMKKVVEHSNRMSSLSEIAGENTNLAP